ncbi:MAG: imipenem/basic amino acid-specific outer membrane pore [Sulfurimonas sp.]|jgi:imipenem/basic amino acid-specific outer membrane pore
MLTVGALVSSVGANEFSDVMSNGTFKGQIKVDSYTKSTGTLDQTSLLMMALRLNYVTDNFYGFSAGASSQTATAPGSNSSESLAMFKGNVVGIGQYSEGTVLSESYLKYKFNKTSVKAGRQYLYMPLIQHAISRIVKQSFSGVTAMDKSLPDTTIRGAYINMVQSCATSDGDIADFEPLDDDNNKAYAISALNKSVKGLSLTGAFGEYQNNYSIFQGEADYKIELGALKYNVALKHAQTTNDDSDRGNPYFTTAKIGAAMKGFGGYLAYSNVSTEEATTAQQMGQYQARHGVAGAATKLSGLYTNTYINASDFYDSKQKGIGLYYKRPGVVVQLRYTDVDITYDDISGDYSDYNTKMFRGVYKFTKDLIGICIYERSDKKDSDDSKEELRLRLVYNF